MKKFLRFFVFLSFILIGPHVIGQPLTGIKTIPGNYATVALAITALNTNGVGAGGVTFNVAAGGSETLGSLTAGTITTLTSTAANPIVFQKSGAGANYKITAWAFPANTNHGGSADAIITISGGDYITFDGIDLSENAANTVTAASTSTGSGGNGMFEYGYFIKNATSSNGAQNNTIKNCTVTLNTTNGFTTSGIYQFGNGTAAGGDNSSNTYLAVTVANATKFIFLAGSSNANALDANCIIQNCIAGTGSTLTVGGNLANATDSSFGIGAYNQKTLTISGCTVQNFTSSKTRPMYGIIFYGVGGISNSSIANNTVNSINNNNGGSAGMIYGIYAVTASQHNLSIHDCTSKNVSCTSSASDTWGIYFNGGTNNTSSLYNNTVQNITSAKANNIYGIYFTGGAGNSCTLYNDNITTVSNTNNGSTISAGIYATSTGDISSLHDCTVNGVSSGNTSVYGIYLGGGTNNTTSLYNLTVQNITSAGANNIYGIYYTGGAGNICSIYSNNVTTVTITNNVTGNSAGIYATTTNSITSTHDCTVNGVSSGTSNVYGIYLSGGTNNTTSVYNLTVQNTTSSSTNTDNIYGLYYTGGTGNICSIYNNNVTTLTDTYNGSTNSAGIYATTTNSITSMHDCIVQGISSGTTNVYGIYLSGGTNNNTLVYYLTVQNVTSAGANNIYGIYYNGGTGNTCSIYSDNVTSVSNTNSATGISAGIYATTSNTVSVFRNCTVQSISGATTSVYGVYLNTVAGSAAVYSNIINTINCTKDGGTIADGLYVNSASTLSLHDCFVTNVTSLTNDQSGMYIITGGTSTIYNNKVYNIANTRSSSSPLVDGMRVAGLSGSTTTIYNNFISAITRNTTTSTGAVRSAGLNVTSASGTPVINIYYNSIWLSGTTKCHSAVFYTTGTVSLNIKNNIFKFSGIQSGNRAYCVYFQSGLGVINSADYNDYDMNFLNTTNYFTGYNGSSDITTLNLWKNVPNDQNSKQFSAYFNSTTDLHLVTVPDNNYDGIVLASITTDIDGEVRGTGSPGSHTTPYAPVIGADEISRSTLAVVIRTNHPLDKNIAKGSTSNIIGSWSLTTYNADGDFEGVTAKLGSNVPLQYSAGTSHFLNFKLWVNTSNSLIGATQLTSTIVSAPAPGSNISFSGFSYFLTGGQPYFLFITADVNDTASPDGTNIFVNTGTISDFTFGPGITKLGSSILAAGGVQTICTFFYNTSRLDSYNILANPSTITYDLTSINGWRAKKTDDGTGMGGTPTNFTNNYQVFNVILDSSTFASAAWTISGTLSRLQVGDGIDSVNLTIPAGIVATCTTDVTDYGTLQLQNAFPSTPDMTLNTLGTYSTVDFASVSGITQYVPAADYGNLTCSNTGSRIFASTDTIGVCNVFKPGLSNTYTVTGSTVNFNGTTIVQTIPPFTFNNLAVNNTSGTVTLLTGSITANGGVAINTDVTIPQGDSIILKVAGASTPSLTALTGILNVNGTLYNSVPGLIFSSSSLTVKINSSGVFDNAAVVTTEDIQIPTGTWANGSTCKITGIVGTTSGGARVDYKGLNNGHGNAQAFSNFYIDLPNLVGKVLLTDNTQGGFSAQLLTVNNTGSNPAVKTGLVQIVRYSTQETVNLGAFVQNSGYVAIANGISDGGVRTLNVAGDFTVNNNIPAYPSRFEIIHSGSSSFDTIGILRVGGNFYMAPGSTLDPVNYGNVANLIFNGSSGNQSAIFSSIVGDLNFEIKKTVSGSGNDTVKLGSNAVADSFKLTKGIFSIGSNTLTINRRVIYPNPVSGAYDNTGTGTFAGSASSNLTLGTVGHAVSALASTLKFASGADTSLRTLKDVLLSTSGVQATLGTNLYITAGAAPGSVTLASGSLLTTADLLTLRSDALGTSRIGISSGTISGKVTVERHIPGYRAWRLITTPLRSGDTLSINSAWQESVVDPTLLDNNPVNPYPYYGTHITGGSTRNAPFVGNTDNGFGPNGFDAAPAPNNSSIFSYSGTAWSVIPQTTHIPVKSQPGWMLFIRGSRATDLRQQTGASATSTILRPKGNVKIGDTTVPISGTGFKVIGNPYASTVNYYNIKHNSNNTGGLFSSYYYAWDPLITGSNNVGAFITYFEIGDHLYTPVPAVTDHSIDKDGSIQSSQAFVIYDSTTNVVISEVDKTSGSDHYIFGRPSGGFTIPSFRTNLYAVNSDGTLSLSDGTLNLFDNSYINGVNLLEDAKKIGQFAENLALQKDSQLLSVEKRRLVNSDDTIFYNIKRMKQKHYRLEFIAENLDQPNLLAFFEDSYTNTRQPVSLDGTTMIDVLVDGNASSVAANRFRIVFKTTGNPLPVSYSSVQAWQQDHDIAVEWKVENEVNIKEYEVEKSTDGRNFVKVNITPARGDAASILYNWLDTHPVNGFNYYRIRSIDNNGSVKYSQVVRVNTGKGVAGIAVYPNPVKDGLISLQLNNMPAGNYQLRLLNNIGQLIQTSTVAHSEGSAAQTLIFNKMAVKGMYQLEIIHPDKSKTNIKLVSQ